MPTPNLHFFFFFSLLFTPILCINITNLLSPYPELSSFSNLLTTTSVAADLTSLSSFSLLAVTNGFLLSSDLTHFPSDSTDLADILRYHVLLDYLSPSDLRRISPSGELVTTLFQTTGRAATNSGGSVNISRNPASDTIVIRSSGSNLPSNATVLSRNTALPYNVSIFSVNSILIPFGVTLMESEIRPPSINITQALIDGHSFNVAVSLLVGSDVVRNLEQDESGAGITLFVATDEAFSNIPPTANFQSLPADQKAVVLKFHVLHSYYPLGSLESIVNPVQPTLATEEKGAASYTLNISKFNGSVSLNTGIVQATVTQTVFDENPVAIFGISKVLLPKEIFGKNPMVVTRPGNEIVDGAQTPDISLSPEAYALSPSPGSLGGIRSPAAINGVQSFVLAIFCVGLYQLV